MARSCCSPIARRPCRSSRSSPARRMAAPTTSCRASTSVATSTSPGRRPRSRSWARKAPSTSCTATRSPGPTTRSWSARRLVADYEERFANPYVAAARGYVDDVIHPCETRPRLIAALEMLADKRDTQPAQEARQHPAVTGVARREPGVSLRKDSRARPFARILIANRGEIALRIIRTCRDLGVEVVAVYSDADVDAAHVLAADDAIRLGPAPAGESYLRADAIIAAALATAAEAVHPGYGFLSERASFARAVTDAGLVFVGPRAAAIEALGDKLAARRTAHGSRRAGRARDVRAGARRSPGCGRGHRRSGRAQSASHCWSRPPPAAAAAGCGASRRPRSCRRRWPARRRRLPRHSATGPSTWNARSVPPVTSRSSCWATTQAPSWPSASAIARSSAATRSSSRRPPAPGLTAAERADLHDMAVRAARAADLHNAATAEFLFDADRRFWFLEVNARLQVEHGVTELVTDLDLVAEQLWIAAGEPLSDDVRAVAAAATEPGRHAIEVRLAAEDPARDFAPAPGRVGRVADARRTEHPRRHGDPARRAHPARLRPDDRQDHDGRAATVEERSAGCDGRSTRSR